MKKLLSVLFLLSFTLASAVYAQDIQIKGTVVSGADNEPLPGVNVVVKGNATTGTITGIDGEFALSVPSDAILSISYIGFKSQDIPLNGKREFKIVLQEDAEALDEVVVVGYGVQKKSVVTASIAKVSSDDLAFTAPVRVDNALKGLAAGVTVTSSSGQPGAAAQIRVRGIGTVNNSDPLYIVDGMPLEGGLDYLNPNDIASIEVLKDAASGAVYGARAANGVVLVTTKTGKEGKTKVTYDFSYGWQNPWRERDVLNATEYAIMMNEGAINSGQAPKYNDPYSYGVGTNWQKETFNNDAPVMNHQVSVSGASEKVNYMFSLGYYGQEGIVGGNYNRSNYNRLTLRSNTQYTIFDESKNRNWLNSLKITSNLSYARVKARSIEANSSYYSPLGSALALSPILTPYAEGDAADAQLKKYEGDSNYTPVYSPDGRLYTIPGGDFNEMINPLASLSLPGALSKTHKFVANFSADLQLWDNLKFRTSYGVDIQFYSNDGYTKKYYLASGLNSSKSNAYSEKTDATVWQLENVLMYDKTIDKHSFSIVLGQSAKKSTGSYLGGNRDNIINLDRPYIDASNGLSDEGQMRVWGGPNDVATLASMFARISYNFDERYMLQATVRRDGSSRFGANNHYATFPSFSLGWNLTNEKFMEKRPEWWTNTKIRLSWGKNGNENIGNFKYTTLTSTGHNVIFGQSESTSLGVKASGLANPDLKWEESEQLDFGLDFGFFNNALTFTVDYYKKKTKGMLMKMNIPSYVGEEKPWGNVGTMENRGVEMELAYKFSKGNWNFRVAGNLSYLENELIEYGNDTGWDNLDSFRTAGTVSRAQNGKPYPYFYGYKTAGIFQNMDEVAAYINKDGGMIQPNAVPGDVRFVDMNGDGKITEDDQCMISKYGSVPRLQYGFGGTINYKKFDFGIFFSGSALRSILINGLDPFLEGNRIPNKNVLKFIADNHWSVDNPNPNAEYPRLGLTTGDIGNNTVNSTYWLRNGSFLRLKNLEIGYKIPYGRIYVSGANLLRFSPFDLWDPELSSWNSYPLQRTVNVGLQLNF